MESRRFLRQREDGKGDLVPAGGVTGSLRLPLLPYERDLIKTLGCTEEEYRRFAEEACRRAAIRPAEYELVPDVKNTGFEPYLFSFVIGLVLQAASYLLTPKPKQPAGRTQSRQLASITSQDRFSATAGFDSQAELANYGDPIPIIFGKYTGFSGGILAAPRLVWSRSFSLGSQQAVKLLMVVGEQGLGDGIKRPDLNGIFLGNTALDATYEHNFAFYWKRNNNDFRRIRAVNLAYGTRGNASSGDIENNDDIFLCPTINGLSDAGFCHSYSPSANAEFGVYSATPNGTDYRVNWRLVPIPEIPDEIDRFKDDPKAQRLFERIKIAGDYDIIRTRGGDGILELRNIGQIGVGRGYGRGMGVTSLNGVGVTSGDRQVRQAQPGDKIVFTIGSNTIPEGEYFIYDKDGTIYKTTQVTDINSEIASGRRAADDALQLGETFMIGRTVWLVESRGLPEWREGQRQSIGLRCIEIFGQGIGSSIGLVSERLITRVILSDDLGATNNRNALGLHAGPGYYPLTKVSFGVVRNSRECEITEIGLRSQVWNRANGLCNFSGLPSPEAFRAAEENGVGTESGTMTLYMKRTACWTIWLRPSGTDVSGQEYKWQPLGERFCVTGEAPQDQFNFIRIAHPKRGLYEFRLIPKSGADVVRHSSDGESFWQLNAKNGTQLSGSYSTPYGTFTVYSQGQIVSKKDISFNPEMASESQIAQPERTAVVPSSVEVDSYLPDLQGSTIRVLAVQLTETPWLPNNGPGNKAATMWELFGQAYQFGLTKTADRTFVVAGTKKTIQVRFTGVVNEFYSQDHPFFPGWRAWNFSSIEVVSGSGDFNILETFDCVIPVTAGNDRAAPYGLTTCGLKLRVTKTTGAEPRGVKSAFAHQALGNANAYAVGTSRSTTFSISSSGRTLQVTMTGQAVAAPEALRKDFPGATNAWDFLSFKVVPSGTSAGWEAGDTASYSLPLTPGNPFESGPQSGNSNTAGVRLRVQSMYMALIPAVFTAPRIFEDNSQLTDISFYNSLLSKSNESAPEHEIVYINESVSNEEQPSYKDLTISGLALKASRNFSSLNQLRVWLADGIPVKRFQADEITPIGPSNNFVDLVYYLLTDKNVGAGSIISDELIDTESMPATSQFLKQNKLFFDGAIEQPVNIRQYISELAPFFLCNFVIKNGKFSVLPSLPTDAAGNISTAPIKIKQLFTAGNIIEGTFSVEYLSTEERKSFQAVMRYRQESRNQFPEERNLVVRWKYLPETTSIETFDMTQYCTTREHAFMVARYFLSLRRRVTHTVRFQTTPYGMDLAPGDYIRVVTQATPYSSANNGVVSNDGTITAVTPLSDGRYEVYYWSAAFDDPRTEPMTVSNGKALESKFFGAIFTLVGPTVSSSTYMIEQLTLTEEGMADIVATHFPTTNALNSEIALDVQGTAKFETED
jgi:hypothetical protein